MTPGLRLFFLVTTAIVLSLAYLPVTAMAATATSTQASIYSGYEVTGSYATLRVKGSWIVPTADCTATPNSVSNISVAFDAINGEGDGFMIGTYQDCTSGLASYGAFLLVYPFTNYYGNKSDLSKLVIHPGDVIEAQGTFRVGASPVQWNTNFVDWTTCTQLDTDAHTASGFTPKQDSGALVLSSDGHTLTSLSTVELGQQYTSPSPHCSNSHGFQGTGNSNIVGPEQRSITFGKMGATTGYTLTQLVMNQITVSPLSDSGSSFTIAGA